MTGNSPSEKLSKCWLCGKEFSGPGYPTALGWECPDCGPPQPWGPTPEELKQDSEDA